MPLIILMAIAVNEFMDIPEGNGSRRQSKTPGAFDNLDAIGDRVSAENQGRN